MAWILLATLLVLATEASELARSWEREEISLEKWKRINALEEKNLYLSIHINSTHLRILQERTILYEFTSKREDGGIHMLVLNERTGSVMASRRFRTYQPSEGKNLRDSLEVLQPGRVVIVVGLPDFLTYLSPEGEVALVRLGARMLPRVCTGEAWAMAAVTGSPSHRATANLSRGKVIAEAVATREYKRPLRSLFLEVTLERAPRDRGCRWHEEAELKDQAEFCRSYEGYRDLCRCGRPLVPARRPRPPPIPMAEEIPVVIVTANKPFHLYRLLKNLFEVAGSGETRVLVVVDGPHLETLQLARLFGVEAAVHSPQGLPGENTRTNMNIAFALYSVFNRWPHVDKAILLEDDLLLAPDIFSYFHQTAWLLTRDPTLYLVSAFGQNSYPSTACDPTTLLRADMYPQYGWMTCRRWATQVLPDWVPAGSGVDWDWWLYTEGVRRGLQAVVPEVSRTAHAGAAGAHVTGWEQHHYFDPRLINYRPHVQLRNVHRLLADNYSEWFEDEIRRATKIQLRSHPCHYNIIPKKKPGPFVLYVGVASRADDDNSFFFMQACLGTDEQEVKEIYEGVLTFRVRPFSHAYAHDRTQAQSQDLAAQDRVNATLETAKARSLGCEKESRVLYIVGCPLSKYCKYSSGTSDWIAPSDSFRKEADRVAMKRKTAGDLRTMRIRLTPKSAREEFNLTNFQDISRRGTW
ncbi:LOW QUALITY PROTEIN: protein O-linked-mannose beta-1,2-N-acetylglucosaminyltransferase 1-like [Penaeus monodon]|uniref:LOW QUALITY PROTEIN: protein O-linked-mannose beta-1,2-N-acetylglucosaminyltransferase 1-like n=1 Tax=Penaeus monodon TaxID=6687 RepID=UPI0018A720A3|nr:LOW QUALITY PROTEIN: protein O-linked-mannose beta-1,2-N-acetylglucosaminyltransferase 1-like [Penaeus monodon]